MEILRYFLYKKRFLVYLGLSVLFALLFGFFTKGKALLELFALIFIELWFLRLADDSSDYEKDGALGKMQLSKAKLRILIVLFAFLFMSLNIIFFGFYGLGAVFILSLILFKEKSACIPPLIGLVSGAYYMMGCIPFAYPGWKEALFLLVLFALSLGYSFIKRKNG